MIWVTLPLWAHTAICIHAFAFGPCYLLFSFVFFTGAVRRFSTMIIAVCLCKLYAGSVRCRAHE